MRINKGKQFSIVLDKRLHRKEMASTAKFVLKTEKYKEQLKRWPREGKEPVYRQLPALPYDLDLSIYIGN